MNSIRCLASVCLRCSIGSLRRVLAANFEQVESAEHGREVRRPGTEQIKDREPTVVAHNGRAAMSYGAQLAKNFDDPLKGGEMDDREV